MDTIYIAAISLFFALVVALVKGCHTLGGSL